MNDLSLNPSAKLSLRHIGRERHPLLVIDDVMTAPRDLVDIAVTTPFSRPDHTFYPGLNAGLPEAYSRELILALRPILKRAFGLPDLPLSYFGFLALATDSPSELKTIQKVPHFDSTDPFRLAMIHYLCQDQKGGTGFFRHRASGFEAVDTHRLKVYEAAIQADPGGDLNDHVGADTAGYDQIDEVNIQFNRLIVYRSHVLHSGLLRGASLNTDPRSGRLTANSFVFVT